MPRSCTGTLLPYLGVAETKKVSRLGRPAVSSADGNLIDRHAEKIVGVLSCFDRLVLQGTLPSVAYPQAMATELDRRGIRLLTTSRRVVRKAREPRRVNVPGHADRYLSALCAPHGSRFARLSNIPVVPARPGRGPVPLRLSSSDPCC